MRLATSSPLVLRVARCLIVVSLAACAGAPPPLGGSSDGGGEATRTSGAPSGPAPDGAGDATTDGTTHQDDDATSPDGPSSRDSAWSPDDASSADDASAAVADAGSDSASAPDAPPLVSSEACHVVWTQPAPTDESEGTFSLVVDPSGNTYVEADYFSEVGVMIAKVDPQCHLAWMRVMSAPPGSVQTSIAAHLAVDSTSSVTLAGTFYGTIDFGDGPVSSPGPGVSDGFVARLDPDGNTVFCDIYPSEYPYAILSASGGTASLLMTEYGAFETYELCQEGLQDSGCQDAGAADGGTSFFSFVQLDATGHEVARHPFGTSLLFGQTLSSAAVDSTGMIWALQNDTGQGGTPALVGLTQYGDVLWSQPFTDGDGFALGPSGGIVVGAGGTAPALSETFQGYGGDGGLLWTQTDPLPGVPHPGTIAVDPTGAIYLAGGLPSPDGGPTGVVGVEVFDPQGLPRELRVAPDAVTEGYWAFGVDPGGTAVIGGDVGYTDAGSSFYVVRIGP